MHDKHNALKVVEVPVDDLKPAAYNPRRHSPEAAEQLRESIARFGMVDPIIANSAPRRKNVVIGGHFRLKVAKDMGFKTVPVAYVRIPNVEREKELNLRLNRNTGEWDFELLKEIDIDLLLDVGFDDADLSDVWDDMLEIEDDDFDTEKELAKIKKSKIRPGDMYRLGTHRLICGDATDPSVTDRLMGKDRADMIYSDPPYNISLDYDSGIGAKGKYGGRTDDGKSDADYRNLLKSAMENALAVAAKDAHVFFWCDQRYIGMLQSLYGEIGVAHKRVCLWVKNNQNPTPKIAFNKAYEPCVYGVRGKPKLNEKAKNLNEILNKEVGTGNRLADDVLDLFDIWLARRVAGTAYEHPTEKPPSLHEKPLRRCASPGDVVLDLFGGSGSTLIACEQMKRRARIVEIEPVFCELIIKRYEQLTGNKAEKLD